MNNIVDESFPVYSWIFHQEEVQFQTTFWKLKDNVQTGQENISFVLLFCIFVIFYVIIIIVVTIYRILLTR